MLDMKHKPRSNCSDPLAMMQQYTKYLQSAKELVDNVAKLTIRQDSLQGPAPQLLQASSSVTSSPGAPRPTVPVEARVSKFKQELLASRINLEELRRLAFQGIPDKDGLRAMTYKVLDATQQQTQHTPTYCSLAALRQQSYANSHTCSALYLGMLCNSKRGLQCVWHVRTALKHLVLATHAACHTSYSRQYSFSAMLHTHVHLLAQLLLAVHTGRPGFFPAAAARVPAS